MRRRYFLSAISGAMGWAVIGPAAAQQNPGAASPISLGGDLPRKPLAEELAEYVDSVRFNDLGPSTVEIVKIHFIDSMGCTIAAFNEGPVATVRNIAAATSGGTATIVGTNKRTTVGWAAFANGTATRYLDLNDGYTGTADGCHPSDNIAPCLAVAETMSSSGQDLILAIALAYEIDCRVADAAPIMNRGWDNTNFSLIAASLASGKLMQLSLPQLTQAVNIALAGHLAVFQTRLGVLSNWKGLADADAGRSAVFAAELARGGITGPAPAFEGKAGFFAEISGPFTVDTAQWGGRSGSFKIADCLIKLYPATLFLQTALVAAAKIGGRIEDLSKVQSIQIDTTALGHHMAAEGPEKWAPETSETADHSLPYIVARALIDREITTNSYKPKKLQDPLLRALMAKTAVDVDPALTKLYPQKIPTRVTVKLLDGRVFSEEVDDLPGFGGRPITRTDVEEKFRRNVKALWSEKQMTEFFTIAWNLESIKDVDILLPAMVVESHAG